MFDSTENTNYQNNDPEYETDIYSLATGNQDEYLQNYDALAKLNEEMFTLYKSYIAVAVVNFTSLIFSPLAPLGFSILSAAGVSFEYFRIITRLHDAIKMLLEYFGNDGITITPRVRTNSAIIDLLIRMPDKRIFALMLRSSEDKSIKWREDIQLFTVAKSGKSAKKNIPLTKAIEQLQTIIDLKKKKHPLMGKISTERNVPLIKAIVLAPESRLTNVDSSELWTDFGQARVLKITTTSTTYVVQYAELIEFLLPPKEKDVKNVS